MLDFFFGRHEMSIESSFLRRCPPPPPLAPDVSFCPTTFIFSVFLPGWQSGSFAISRPCWIRYRCKRVAESLHDLSFLCTDLFQEMLGSLQFFFPSVLTRVQLWTVLLGKPPPPLPHHTLFFFFLEMPPRDSIFLRPSSRQFKRTLLLELVKERVNFGFEIGDALFHVA